MELISLQEIPLQEILRQTGISHRTFSYYRDRGLIPKPIKRTTREKNRKGSIVFYPPRTLYYIEKINFLKKEGRTLDEIKEILNLEDELILQEKELRKFDMEIAFGDKTAIEKLIEMVEKRYPGRKLIEFDLRYKTKDQAGMKPRYIVTPVKIVLSKKGG